MKIESGSITFKDGTTTIPTKWLKGIGVMVATAMVGACIGGAGALLPKKGTEAAESAVVRSDRDNANIISHMERIEALNSKLDALTTAVANLEKTDSELKEDVRDLNKRIDTLYQKP